jgi:hypothetical protein
MLLHTLASVDQSLVCRPKKLPILRDEEAWGWILEGTQDVRKCALSILKLALVYANRKASSVTHIYSYV